MITRRQFSSRAALLSASSMLPAFLADTAARAAVNDSEKILVVIQLDGGNDGLNTVVPYSHDVYKKRRPKIALRAGDVIKIDDQTGLNPAMFAASQMLEEDRLAIVNGVGYPNPDRSHFRSMEIWHSASNKEDETPTSGWAGRAMDQAASGGTDAVFVGKEDLPLSLRGRRAVTTSMLPGQTLKITGGLDPQLAMPKSNAKDDLSEFVHRNLASAYQSVQEFNRVKRSPSAAAYPGNALSRRLATIAKFIGLETKARVFYAIHSGFDTHGEQLGTHDRLLRDFAGATRAFLSEIEAMGLADRVVVLAFSEFGRRVNENGSAGTDHGTAGPVFLAGTPVRSGFVNPSPNLDDLDGDDLKMQVDFRQIYATLLEDWLEIPSAKPLGAHYQKMPLFVS